MLARERPTFFGFSSIFRRDAYPVFEKGIGARYLREYVPLHLPQVEQGLRQAHGAIVKTGRRPSRILDIGSGPGTVAMGLRNLIHRDEITGNWRIDAIDPSAEFCEMLKKAGVAMGTRPIYMNPPLQMGLQEYLDRRKPCATDWIVMANVLSALAHHRTLTDCIHLFDRLFELQQTIGAAPALTLIEGSCRTYIDPYAYFNELAARFRVLAAEGLSRSISIPSPHVLKCRYYGRPGQPRGCSPRMIMITITPHKG